MFEAFKVGVTIALTNQVSQGLHLMGRDLMATERRLKSIQTEFNRTGYSSLAVQKRITASSAAVAAFNTNVARTKQLALGGVVAGAAGYALLKPLHASYEAAKRYEAALNQFKAINLGDAVNRDADKFARGANVMGNSATDMITALREMHTALGDYDHAKAVAPLVARIDYANHALGNKGATAFTDDQRKRFGQVIEMRGGFASASEMTAQADMMQRVMSGTGYMVMPRDYRDFLSRGGIAAQKMSNRAFYYQSEPLIQMMGGSAVGTGMETARRRMVMGQGSGSAGGKAYVELLDKIGLVDRALVETNALTGKITKIQPGFLKHTDEYERSAYDHMEKYVVPGLKARGQTEDQIETSLAMIYGRTGGKAMVQWHRQYLSGAMGRKIAVDENAMGEAELVRLARSSPQGAEDAMGKAWENLKITAGEVLIPIVIPAILKFTAGLRALGRWADAHPTIFKWLTLGLLGLGSALLFSGSVMLLRAAFLGLSAVIGLGGGAGLVKGVGLLAAGAGGLAKGVGSLLPLLVGPAGLVVALGAVAVATIGWHKEIADRIDGTGWGKKLGDGLLAARDWLAEGDTLPNRSAWRAEGDGMPGTKQAAAGPTGRAAWSAPPPRPNPPLEGTLRVQNGHLLVDYVSKGQSRQMNGPLKSSNLFDAGQSFVPVGASGTW